MSIPPRRLLRIADARARLGGISRSSFYRLVRNDARFPKLIKLGGVSLVDETELDAFIGTLAVVETVE